MKLQKWIFTGLMALSTSSFAIPSVLTAKANLPSIGQVAYRAPMAKTSGDVIVLFQGVFGGTTHRHMSELRQLLDDMGYRVYTMDLPGTGESASPKIIYNLEILNTFVTEFLMNVVKEPAIVVGEQLLGTASLHVSKVYPELFKKIILVSPAGVKFLAGPPVPPQNDLFNKFWNDDEGALTWYQGLVGEKSARYYLGKAYYRPESVTVQRVEEITMTSQFAGQRWATLSFVGGRIYGSFAEAAKDVTVPVTAVFGEFPGSPVTGMTPETMEMFQAVQPNFEYVKLNEAANLPHKEQAAAFIREAF